MHQSQLLKTNESQWSILLKRWCVTRRPHRLMKTSSMQSKRHNLHCKWSHHETNESTWLLLRTYLFCSASGKLHLLWYLYIYLLCYLSAVLFCLSGVWRALIAELPHQELGVSGCQTTHSVVHVRVKQCVLSAKSSTTPMTSWYSVHIVRGMSIFNKNMGYALGVCRQNRTQVWRVSDELHSSLTYFFIL